MLLPGVPRVRVPSAVRPAVETPFGALTFATGVGGLDLPPVPDELFELPGGRTVARWVGPAARVELLLTAYDPELDPEHWGPLTGCRAAVWRLDAFAPLDRVRFSAGLPSELPVGVEAGWDGGQGLCAITAEDEGTLLTFGGNDEEAICWAAECGEAPRRWAALTDGVNGYSFDGWGVDCAGSRAITWRLPPLEAGDHCELPVVAAWAPAAVAEACANTWYAVMPSPTVLLRQVAADVAERAEAAEGG